MSLDATRWAWQQEIPRSIDKLVLLSLADRADESHQCYPSIIRLAHDTGCDRKTVMEAIRRLEELGLIVADKTWGKSTRYQLIGVTERHERQSQKRDQYQKRDESQKRYGTSTKNGTGPVPKTGHEPINNLPITKKDTARAKKRAELDWSAIPESAHGEPLDDWLEHRRQIKAPITTPTGVSRLAAELRRCEDAGISAAEAISEAIDAGWRGIKLGWIQKRRSSDEESTRTGNNSRASRFAETVRRYGDDAEEVDRGAVSENAVDLRPPLDGQFRRH